MPGEPIEVKARRRAMATVARYNEVLVRLNSGATGNQLGGEVRRLSSNLGGLLQFASVAAGPLAGLAGDTLAQLATVRQNLCADQELREALVAGAPLIQELLAAMIAETSNLYAIKLRDTLDELNPLRTEINTRRAEIRQVVRGHAAPGDERLAGLSDRLERAFSDVGIAPMPLPPLAGEQAGEPFDAAVDQELTRKVEAVEQLATRYTEHAVTLHAFHAALGAYVAMLYDTSTALDHLAASAAAPQTITIDLGELSQQVAAIRANASEVRRALQDT